MSERELIKQLRKLPTNARREAEDFVDFLYQKYIKDTPTKSGASKKKSILDSSFRGMWKDREDLTDSTTWVRSIRKNP